MHPLDAVAFSATPGPSLWPPPPRRPPAAPLIRCVAGEMTFTRLPLVCGNWKLNPANKKMVGSLVTMLNEATFSKQVQVAVAPSQVHLTMVRGKFGWWICCCERQRAQEGFSFFRFVKLG